MTRAGLKGSKDLRKRRRSACRRNTLVELQYLRVHFMVNFAKFGGDSSWPPPATQDNLLIIASLIKSSQMNKISIGSNQVSYIRVPKPSSKQEPTVIPLLPGNSRINLILLKNLLLEETSDPNFLSTSLVPRIHKVIYLFGMMNGMKTLQQKTRYFQFCEQRWFLHWNTPNSTLI